MSFVTTHSELPAAAVPVTAHAGMYQALSAQVPAVHQPFVTAMEISAGSCAATEAANAVAVS
jgi:hypothetical protein